MLRSRSCRTKWLCGGREQNPPLSINSFESDENLRSVFKRMVFFHKVCEFRKFFNLCSAFCPMDGLTYYEGVTSITRSDLHN